MDLKNPLTVGHHVLAHFHRRRNRLSLRKGEREIRDGWETLPLSQAVPKLELE